MKRFHLTKVVPPLCFAILAMSIIVSCHKRKNSEAEGILRRQEVRFSEPPERIPSPCSVDAPLMGNGFTGVALSGPPEALVFHLARNDFWRLRSAHDETLPLVLGLVKSMVPKLEGASYQIDQSLYDAIHDGTIGTMNPILSLGLARMVMDIALDMSEFPRRHNPDQHYSERVLPL